MIWIINPTFSLNSVPFFQELLLHGASQTSELPGAAGQLALERLKDEEDLVESITCSESLGGRKTWGKNMGKIWGYK